MQGLPAEKRDPPEIASCLRTGAQRHGRFYVVTERGFDWALRTYDRGLTWSLHHPITVLAFSLVVLGANVGLFAISPFGFLPTEDTGRIVVRTEAGEGTGWESMKELQRHPRGPMRTS